MAAPGGVELTVSRTWGKCLVTVVVAGLGGAALLAAGPASGVHAATATTYYVAPTGSDSAAGTLNAPWASLARAQSAAVAGDTVYLRGGTYRYTAATTACASRTARVDAITLNRSGAAGNPIRYWAYPGERPVFDFSGMRDDCRIKGFDVTGNWLHLKGLEVTGVRQNNSLNHESWGVWVSGSNNTFELIDAHHNMGPGLFIQNGSGNLVLNSDSHHNYDPLTSNGAGESADGFGAHVPAGRPGTVFRGCRAWSNSDDGFDLINAYSPVTIEGSWAWLNGYVPDTTRSAGNGNGFKAGGYGGDYDAAAVPHVVRTSVAFKNKAAGFYANHHPVASEFVNNTGFSNRPNFNMLGIDAGGAAVGRGILRNNLAYGGTATSNLTGTTATTNSWNLGRSVTDADFRSLSTAGWDAPRQAGGALPVLASLRLATGSPLVDAGTPAGVPFRGTAPDLGAFES